jgi:phosphoribosylanthranilate isomerase
VNVKLCGLQTEADLEAAREAKATHVGFLVQAPASHRNLQIEDAARLAEQTPDELTPVLVTPTDDPEEIETALGSVPVDVVQATGDIEVDRLREIADGAGVDAWKGLSLADQASTTVERIDACADLDAVVLDALQAGYGGSGDQIDWGHAAEAQRMVNVPIVLAGGLTTANVAEGIRHVDPWCVDVSSGIETDGDNDPEKMRAFVQATQEAPR